MVSSNDVAELLIKCGINPSEYTTLSKKIELLNAIWLHFVFFEVHTELQQFKKGFRETLEMEVLVGQNPVEIRSLLVPSDLSMTAKALLDLFTVNYSSDEIKRCLEDQVIAYWRRYIVNIEAEGT